MYLEKISLEKLAEFVKQYSDHTDTVDFNLIKEGRIYNSFNQHSPKPSPEEYKDSRLDICCYGVNVIVSDFELKQGYYNFFNSAKNVNQTQFAKFMLKNLPKDLREQYVIDYAEHCKQVLDNNYTDNIIELNEEIKSMKSLVKRYSIKKEELQNDINEKNA